MAIIIGLSGSLRRGSFNSLLLRAAARAAPPGTTIEIASIQAFPLYNGDVEASDGVPAAVEELKNAIAGAQGLLIATPEYNNSMPGVLKNAIDWLTRPPADIPRVFRDRPVAIMGATPGRGGTTLAQTAWLPVVRALGMTPWFGARLMVSEAGKLFDEAGDLRDDATRGRLEAFVKGFAEFAAARRG